MKKIIFLLLVFAASFASAPKVSAQDSGWWLGGRIGYWHNKVDGVSSNSFALAPEFGYDINSKWSVAGVLGFGYQKVTGVESGTLFLEPYARYKYFRKGAFSLFVDGGVGIALAVLDVDNGGWKIGCTHGMALKISDHFSLLTTFGFLGYKNDYYNGGGDGFGFDLKSSDLRFGFFYTF